MIRAKMIAEHDGTCGLCGESIEEGDPIELFDDEWCHVECVDEEQALQEQYER